LLAGPYHLNQAVVGVFSVVYLSGIYSSAKIGSLADRLGRRKVLWAVIVMMLVGLSLTLFTALPMVVIGVLIFTFGFFGAHSVSSSWVGRRATKARGQASSLYLFCYYVGSSVAGTGGGVFWHYAGWNGIGLFVGVLLLIALGVALRLAKLQPLAANG
jgi:YNFM family putative membrane transporter